jgi:lia operon protein LiaF
MKNNKAIGVFFIIVGLIFLMNNLDLLDISLGEIIRVYWPVIIIWLGIDKLLRKKEDDK